MANTASKLYDVPIFNKALGGFFNAEVIKVSIDTVDQNLTIKTTTALEHCWLIGLIFSESDAAQLTWTLDGLSEFQMQLGANQGLFAPSQRGMAYLATQQGESLILKSNTAIDLLLTTFTGERY